MSGLFEKKRQIRQKILASVRELDLNNRYDFDFKIQNSFLNSDFFKNSKSLALYFPLPEEISTTLLFEKSVLLCKKIAFPKVLSSGELEFYWVSSLTDLQETSWGLKEPKLSLAKLTTLDELDLILVPGVAFDREKNRLGRGKGFYDKALKNYKGHKVSLAYSMQILSQLPKEGWDVKVNSIFSENECIT